MIAWLKVILYGTLGKLIAKLLAPIMVLFVDRASHPIWGNSWTDDFSYWNSGWRNGAHNAFRKPQVPFEELSNSQDETLEKLEGFQWRYRKSLGGRYVSFRCTWGKPRPQKGKREFYIGWTMRPLGFEDNTMALTFFQLRPF